MRLVAVLLCAGKAAALCSPYNFTPQMLMYSGTSPMDLGNYEACLAQGNAHHCVFSFDTRDPEAPTQGFWLDTPLTMTGLCVPKQCTENDTRTDVAKWLSVIDAGTAKSLGLNFTDLWTKNTADVTCSENRARLGQDPQACLMLVVVLALAAMVGVATITQVCLERLDADNSPEAALRRALMCGDPRGRPGRPHSKRMRALLAFSALKNFDDLVGHRHTDTNFFNGMRFFSIVWYKPMPRTRTLPLIAPLPAPCSGHLSTSFPTETGLLCVHPEALLGAIHWSAYLTSVDQGCA